jgi:adhesin transport system outer membrane protein
VQAQAETARLAKLYAQYRVLAAENQLINCLGVQRPAAAVGNERDRFHVNPIPPSDLQENSFPYPTMGAPATATPAAAPAPMPAEPAPAPADAAPPPADGTATQQPEGR